MTRHGKNWQRSPHKEIAIEPPTCQLSNPPNRESRPITRLFPHHFHSITATKESQSVPPPPARLSTVNTIESFIWNPLPKVSPMDCRSSYHNTPLEMVSSHTLSFPSPLTSRSLVQRIKPIQAITLLHQPRSPLQIHTKKAVCNVLTQPQSEPLSPNLP